MPAELRRLLFHEDEVKSALLRYLGQTRKPKLRGSFRSLHLEERPDLRAFIAVMPETGELITLEVGTAEIAAALILYCKQIRIPLPARAAKKLNLEGRGVQLSLTLGSDYVSLTSPRL